MGERDNADTTDITDILDTRGFLSLHPWPTELLSRGEPTDYLWHVDLDGHFDKIWVFLCDTSRLNRALGLPEMHIDEQDGRVHGKIRMGGVLYEWFEDEWDWVWGHHLATVRYYRRGLAEVGRGIYHLQTLGEGRVRVYIYFGWILRGWFARMCFRIGMANLQRQFEATLPKLVASHLAHGALPPPSVAIEPGADERLGRIEAELTRRLGPSPAIRKLMDYIVSGDELDMYRLQVPALARRLGVEEAELLRVCLHATRLGLLNLSWDVVCPHCRGPREEAGSLADLPEEASCSICQIDFTTNEVNAVEVTFHVHPSIRAIPKRFFCTTEPSLKMHIRLQKRVPPGASVRLSPRLDAGRYRLRVKGREGYSYLDIYEGRPAETITWRASQDLTLTSGPDPAIELVNDTNDAAGGGRELLFIIESAVWSDNALRPARLFNFQEFRDLFSEEYVSTGVQLHVGEQTILFTDMVGSTRFYADRGDPEAFAEIKRHFAELAAIINAHQGAVIKTIGDAVMAAFASPVDAIAAAHKIHQCYDERRTDTPIRLRASLNTGPCIAVNLNNRLDYFGGTVNLAAKLQACAGAGDIAMSESVYAASGVRAYIEDQGGKLEESKYRVSALDKELSVWCWATFAQGATGKQRAISLVAATE